MGSPSTSNDLPDDVLGRVLTVDVPECARVLAHGVCRRWRRLVLDAAAADARRRLDEARAALARIEADVDEDALEHPGGPEPQHLAAREAATRAERRCRAPLAASYDTAVTLGARAVDALRGLAIGGDACDSFDAVHGRLQRLAEAAARADRQDALDACAAACSPLRDLDWVAVACSAAAAGHERPTLALLRTRLAGVERAPHVVLGAAAFNGRERLVRALIDALGDAPAACGARVRSRR